MSLVDILRKERNFQSGGVAQLGEHLPCKQGVSGSNPLTSTNNNKIFPEEPVLISASISKYLF